MAAQSSFAPYHYIIGEEELFNADIYTIYYDDEAQIIYIGTDEGVYQYRQSTFQKLRAPKGAIGTSYFALQESPSGALFCNNLNGQVFEISGDSLSLYYTLPDLGQVSNFQVFFDEEGTMWSLGNALTRLVDTGDRIVVDTLLGESQWMARVYPTNQRHFLYGVDGLFERKIGFRDSSYVFEEISQLCGIASISPEGHVVTQRDRNKENQNIRIRDYSGKILGEIEKSEVSIFWSLTDSTVASLGDKSGCFILRWDGEKLRESKEMFSKKFISCAYQSSDGTLFLGTFKSGLIIIPEIEIQGWKHTDLLTDIVHYQGEGVIVSTRGGKIFLNASTSENEQLVRETRRSLRTLFVSNYKVDIIDQLPHLLYIARQIRNAVDVGRDSIAYTIRGGLLIRHKDRFKTRKQGKVVDWDMNTIKIKALAVDTLQKVLYYGDELFLYRNRYSGKAEQKLAAGAEMGVSDLAFDEGHLYAGTREQGVQIFEGDLPIDTITVEDGLYSDEIIRVKVFSSLLYIHSRGGLQIYDLQHRQFKRGGNETHLLNSPDIIDFDVSEQFVYVLKKDQYYIVPQRVMGLQNEVSTPIIDSILVNGKLKIGDQSRFAYNEHSFYFYFDYRDIQNKFNTSILYKLEGLHNQWREIVASENLLVFEALPPGEYTLRLKASFQGETSNEFMYSFRILPPYWQKWWFYLLIVGFGGMLVGIIAYTRLRVIQQQAEQELQIETNQKIALNAQLKAIRAQMNPHFIFNAINSIQDLILKQDTLRSYDYLTTFAKLVRMILNFSEREFVSLQDESIFLKLYLDLEALRFGDSFEYHIQIPPELETENIPSLMVQPFIENAIKHGLLHKKGPKKLEVNFSRNDQDQIICVVEDNGVGRGRAQEIQNRRVDQHRSFSSEAIQKRMQILTTQLNHNFDYSTIDLVSAEGEATGTKVEIRLPIIRSLKE